MTSGLSSLLEGVNVVALEQAVAGPFATRQLADWGARVIKIERPRVGDFARSYDQTVKGLSSHFVWLNRSKESLTLNLKDSKAREILLQLLDRADVFIQNLSPGAIDRLGLSSDQLRERYSELIICNITGYGRDGPYREKKAYDLLIQGETGLLSVTGTSDAPSKAGISIADIAAGVYAYSGIFAALYKRERTGKGSTLDVSLFDALAEWMSYPAYYTAYGGQPPARTGAHHATIAPYGPVRTEDGKEIIIGLQNEREWSSFCEHVLLQPDLSTDRRFTNNHWRHASREQLDEIIASVTNNISTEVFVKRLENAKIAYGYLNDMKQLWNHPQITSRNRFCEIETSNGRINALLPPVSMDNEEIFMGSVPRVGEHTNSILKSLGYDMEQIEQLRADGVI